MYLPISFAYTSRVLRSSLKASTQSAAAFMAAVLLGLSAAAPAAQATTLVQSPQARVELLTHAPEGVAPGKTLWLGLQIAHAPDWHTYWKNPGDSGLPTLLEWKLPAGVTVGEIAWPTPRKFPIGDLANYGYDGTVVLPVPLNIAPEFNGNQIDVGLYASWLICRRECIPEEGNFALQLPVEEPGSPASPMTAHAQAFQTSFDAVPTALQNPPAGNAVVPSDNAIAVTVGGLPASWQGRTLEFYPETGGIIEPGAPWQQRWEGTTWHAEVPLSPHRFDAPESMVLVLAPANPPGKGVGQTGVQTDVPVQGAWPALAALPAPTGVSDALAAALEQNALRAANAPPPPSTPSLTLWAALLGALVGGMILNLMPCVFPVLAIKVMSFAQHGQQRRAHRMGGLAYTAGVVLSFMALGALLLGLRAAGEQLGWGFQLQSPAVVAGLAVLFTVIGLNLAGLFEFGRVLPSSVASLQAKNPTVDSFLTGVLATAIASPCTAPFMGASLGLAIALPAPQALAVFAALGLGMALPYLAASWIPAVARALPRPGAWMETFRQLMAFPMFATVVWLVWVLGQQSGVDGAVALLMLLVVLALVIWALAGPRAGLGQAPSTGRRVLSGLSVAALAWLVWAIGPHVTQLQQDSTAGGASVPTAQAGVAWNAWTPERQAELLAQGRPVFVDFTAAWCVTCQYNKRTTLADAAVLSDVASKNVALLRADWTRRDPAVTEALAQLGRNGVPVYVIYYNGRPPVVLSEILSVEEVRTALAAL